MVAWENRDEDSQSGIARKKELSLSMSWSPHKADLTLKSFFDNKHRKVFAKKVGSDLIQNLLKKI